MVKIYNSRTRKYRTVTAEAWLNVYSVSGDWVRVTEN
jgi:hypothetical protein